MLDRSVPYFNVIMRRKASAPLSDTILPTGYSFVGFTEGKEEKWAEIEASVGEFENTQQAVEYFHRVYVPHLSELKQRLLFVQTADGEEVGTITSWWNYTGDRRDPSVHWLAVKAGYQGLGLGHALVSECLKRFVMLEGHRDVFLHTQTWSYKAIRIYLTARFEIVRGESFGDYQNDYEEAIPILRERLPSGIL